ncbi:hypothetical protein [Yersinia enterocolitica]|uniref:hypothetical protein n=1 Tax=Yersinia enterocolitica TaxID=630 RepID=UPI00330DCCEA|nr:hypothetical protein [Yersinia enterocolitica]
MAYIIKRGILVTLETYDAFIEDIYQMPFLGKDQRQSPSFYREIQQFLQHLICNVFLYAKDTPEEDLWTQFSPISSKLGKDKLPFVFEQSKYLFCDRALELFEKTGIIKIRNYSFEKKRCRQFALSKTHFCSVGLATSLRLTTAKRRRNIDVMTEESLIQKALD